MVGVRFLIIGFVFLAGACRDEREAFVGGVEGPQKGVEVEAREGGQMKPMKKVQILVGGCMEECSEPGLALTRFLEALQEGDLDKAERFLDTTALKIDGEELGRKWATMWKEMRTKTRRDSIREALKDLATWKEGLSREEARSVLTSGLRPVRLWSSEAVYDLLVSPSPWRFRLRPRGLEWLIVEVGRRGEAI